MRMSTWACPNCLAPCGDAERLVEHLVSSYLGEQAFTPSTFSNKRNRRASVEDDKDYGNRQAESKLDHICPYPRCGNKKQYSTKANLLRHFFTHCTDSEAAGLKCPCCFKSKGNLGALSAHWNKSCKKKFGTHRLITKDERHQLDVFEKKKAEMSMRLTVALNQELGNRHKQACRSRPALPESFSCGSTVDTSGASTGKTGQGKPAAKFLSESELAMLLTQRGHEGPHGMLSIFGPAWSIVPYVEGGNEASTTGNEWWAAHELDWNSAYNSELVNDIDPDLEAWVLD